jgi:hypothetical protein
VTAILTLIAGIVLVGLEVLPRIGYANPDPTRPIEWSCAT